MKTLQTFCLLLASILFVSACSGGSDSKPAASVNQTPAPQPTPEPEPEPKPTPEVINPNLDVRTWPTNEPAGHSALYPADWAQGLAFDHPGYAEPLFLQDYSYAGYHNGEVAIPSPAGPLFTVETDITGAVDASGAIQTALNQAQTAGGGVVYLPAGLYRIDAPLSMKGANIVLRGAGSGFTKLWFRNGGGTNESNRVNLTVEGSNWLNEQFNEGWRITETAHIFDTSVRLTNASGLSVGDNISIAWDMTQAFKEEHNSEDFWYYADLGARKTFFRRTITAIDGNRVHFKVPLRYTAKLRDNPVVLRTTHYAEEMGVEALSMTNAVGVEAAWSGFDQARLLLMRFCKNCWIRDVKSFANDGASHHVRSHAITVERSFQVTVADSHLQKVEHLGEGGNGYLFQISQANEVLIRDSVGEAGRHNFSINWDFGASGNVFLRITSRAGLVCRNLTEQLSDSCSTGPSDFHHALAIANLFDHTVIDDQLDVGNRQQWSSGAGQTGTLNVFWNTQGSGGVNAYNQGVGYVIGTGADIAVRTDLAISDWPVPHISLDTAPEDYTELTGSAAQMATPSLYEDQLARRLP